MTALTRCQSCGFTQVAGLATEPPLSAGEPCPSCGITLEPSSPGPGNWSEHGLRSVQDYLQTLREILFKPDNFFKRMPHTGGLASPLAFALITHWIAAALSFIWLSIFGLAATSPAVWIDRLGKMGGMGDNIDYAGRGEQMAQMQSRLASWFWGAGSIIADPFITLITVLLTSAFVYMGARIFVPRPVTYQSAVRILSYGMAPSILGSIPFFGTVIAGFWILIATVAGAREVYKISTTRALLIVLFPKLLVLLVVLAILLTMIMLVFGLIFTIL